MTIDILSNMVTRGALPVLVAAALSCASPGAGGRLDSAGTAQASRLRPLAPPAGATAEDLNGDGKPDAWTVGSAGAGREVRLYDLDGDAGPDVALTFEGGRLVRVEILRPLESVPASTSVFQDGKLVPPAAGPGAAGSPAAAAPPAQK